MIDMVQESATHKAGDNASALWKLLIVDDDADIHQVTRMALRRTRYEDRSLEFISAKSEKEAREVLAEHKDIAVVLLDVIMEARDSGLRLVKFIREELGNDRIRIIIRTGQPGEIPADSVVRDYEINDYKSKTEITRQVLIDSVVSQLDHYSRAN